MGCPRLAVVNAYFQAGRNKVYLWLRSFPAALREWDSGEFA